MTAGIRRVLWAMFLSLVTLCASQLTAGAAVLDGSWWHTGTPAVVQVHYPPLPPHMQAGLEHSVANWNATGYVQLVLVPDINRCYQTTGQINICLLDMPLTQNGGTVWKSQGKRLKSAESFFDSGWEYAQPWLTEEQRQYINNYVFCHELGHAIGLGHDYPGTAPGCMGEYQQTDVPGPDDIASLAQLYG